jgi:hypothetical protein
MTGMSDHSQSQEEDIGSQTGQWDPQPLKSTNNSRTKDLEGAPTKLHVNLHNHMQCSHIFQYE